MAMRRMAGTVRHTVQGIASTPPRVSAVGRRELNVYASGAGGVKAAPKCAYAIDGCHTLVMVRHGESEWNAAKRFTGWVDVDLTDKGRLQATNAGRLLKCHNFAFEEAHTSVLKRAVRTLWTALHSSDHHWIPVKHTWRLNERHYGGLTGLSKSEAEIELGKEMLMQYRRGFDTEPLAMEEDHPYYTGNDRRYRDLGKLLPRGESLQLCQERILPYWYESIVPSIRSGRRVLIAAHNNVIRCIAKHLDDISVDCLRDIDIPTGQPLVYNLDKDTLMPVGEPDEHGFRGRFLEDPGLDETTSQYAHVIHPDEIIDLESLRAEAKKLGIDASNIHLIKKCPDTINLVRKHSHTLSVGDKTVESVQETGF